MHHACEPWHTPEHEIVSRGREKGHLAVRERVHARDCGSGRRFLCEQSWSTFLKWTVLICCEFPGPSQHHEILIL